MKEIDENNKSFENIKHIDENGTEFWYARELMPILQYSNWQNFEKIIQKAKISCENSGIAVIDHFTDVNKMVQIGSGAYREQIDYKLTRYACYLIAQKRNLTRKGNYSLNQTAKKAGVKNFDKFHNSGYKGLYNGETADDIAKRKGLRYREDILDNMGSEELAANLFRITQTESRLKRDKVDTEKKACDTHNKIGKIVRKAIKEAGRNYARRFANS